MTTPPTPERTHTEPRADLLKICTYRPFRLIQRDPSASTYEVGDDKFPTFLHPQRPEDARRIVELWNALAGISDPEAAIREVREALKAAIECRFLFQDSMDFDDATHAQSRRALALISPEETQKL